MSKTYSTQFLSPMLPSEALKTKRRFGLVNLYVGDLQHDVQHENAIYALYKPKFTVKFDKFICKLQKHPRFQELYGIKRFNGEVIRDIVDHIMIVFDVPGRYIEDYQKFLKGDYSKFSLVYKHRFRPGTNIYRVIHRDPRLKKHWEKELNVNLDHTELMAKPKMDLEIFRYTNKDFKLLKDIWKLEK